MCAPIREIPFQPEIAFVPRGRVRGNDGNKECTVLNFAPDFLIPRIPTTQLALIEPDLDAGRAQRLANLQRRVGILRGVTEEHSARMLRQKR